METIKYFISFYKPYKGMFWMDLICASIVSAVDVAFPLIFSFCTGSLFTQSKDEILHWLGWVVLGLLIMYVIRTLCRFYVTYQGHVMGARMETDMREDLFEKFEQLSFGYYDRHNTGTLSSHVISDLFDIAELAHHGPENIFISLIKIIGSFVVMGLMNWQLTLCLLVIVVIMLGYSALQNKKMEETFLDNRKKIAEINNSLIDSLEGIRVSQSFANEDLEIEKFAHSNKRYLQSKESNYRAMGYYYAGNHFFTGMLYTTIIGVGGLLAANGQLSAPELAAFVLYVNVFVNPLEILIEFTEMFQKGFSGFRRFEEVMKEVPEIQDLPGAIDLKDVKGEISFDDVSFEYTDDQPVLTDISFTIPAGKNYALAGPSGSGKTTICSLIPRFYDTVKGSVKIDGKDIRDFTLKSLRENIGVVQQDVYLFDGTIAENIRYGRWDATDEEVMDAAKKANLQDLIESLPEGLNTLVGEKGARLSGGQKQRISIARIFLKDPKILILDEATSALDNESEWIVQKSLQKLSENRTCLTIAHRLSTIQNADRIFVVDSSGIVQQGTHEELASQDGLYRSYCLRQFEDNETVS